LRFATVAVIGSDWLLSSNKILPMPGTLGQDGILRADWQSAHRSFGPPMKMKNQFPTLVESISYAVFQGSRHGPCGPPMMMKIAESEPEASAP
jgi:hypothetical protein